MPESNLENHHFFTEFWWNRNVQIATVCDSVFYYVFIHGLWTPHEGINWRNLKNWADVADKICFGRTKQFGIGIEFSAVQWRLFSLWASVVRVFIQLHKQALVTNQKLRHDFVSLAWPHFWSTQMHSPPNGDFRPRIWAKVEISYSDCSHITCE